MRPPRPQGFRKPLGSQDTQPRPRPRRSNWRLWGLVLLGESLVLLAAAVIIAFLLYRSDLILPGVETLSVELGGMSKAEAAILLQQHWQSQTIILDASDTIWTVTPALLGMTLHAEATAQVAHRQGRSLATLQDTLKAGGHVAILPIWELDPAVAEANLQTLAPQLDVPPVDAGLRVVADRVEATPSQAGRALDVAATVAWLKQNAAQVFTGRRLPLAMVPIPPAVTDASAVLAQANQLLVSPLSIHAYDPITDEKLAWTVAPDVWGTWLSLGVDPADSAQLHWDLNTEQVQAFLAEQATTLGPDRYLALDEAITAVQDAIAVPNWDVPLRIYHHEWQHIVQSGDTLSKLARDYGIPYPWIQQANPDMGDTLYAGQALTIPSPDALLPLPVVENKRIVVSLSEQKMWAYENGALKWQWPVSTGIPSSPTAPGVFQVQTHEPNAYASQWDLWMPHFLGIYQPVPASDFMNGFHGFPTRGRSQLLWTNDLGHPVTYGCILISTENAVALYEWAEEGVVVEVRP
ncbi:MAG: L,D-transpeptidase family protein [Anaerolineae bacterium]|nr:L,D-transpeptidase family protein [Anaerolineae bacterium]